MKSSSSRNSESSTQFDSPHSPLRYRSSPLSDGGDPFHSPENFPEGEHRDNSRAIVILETSMQYAQVAPPVPESEHRNPPVNEPPTMTVNRAATPETQPATVVGGGGQGRLREAPAPTPAWPKRVVMAKKVALGFRLSEVVLCLISFSVMAADKTQGWSGDSFDRYKEYRYCLSVNVIAFAYAAFQACDLAYQLVTGRQIIKHHTRHHFDFFMDQVLAYLLISAASSAATRVDDWQSNWGKDDFTEMASASIAMAFLAFIAFAISSLISGYNLCTLYS
ncbi:CASP-like protein 4A3 [Abrus precatorius]|uniref:CASP-like protein n=1 Tax=Abrus precatorius TaxID=3816 RepID=A0A8B8JN72_ABRPR|nr:CASP-like protein 4A3 [Abrus precatorius]